MASHRLCYASVTQLLPSRQASLVLQCVQMRSPSQSLMNSLRRFKHRRCSLSCSRSGAGFSLLWRSAIMLMESGFQNSFILSAWWRIRSADIPPSALGHLRQRRRPPRRDGSRGSPTGREDGRSSRAACHGFLPRSEFSNATTVMGRRPSRPSGCRSAPRPCRA